MHDEVGGVRPVEVTWHALEQFRTRFPQDSGSASYTRLLIAREINEAFEMGRYATRQPRWAKGGKRTRGRRNGSELDRTMRYCWTEGQHRMYLVDRRNGLIRVITSISPFGDSPSA